MGSEVINPTKPPFDLTMSRRTRKPWSSLINDLHIQDLSTQTSQAKPDKEEQDKDREFDRQSLNNLMRCEEESNEEANVNNKSSLSEHFEDDEGIKEKKLQLVVKKEKQNGVKFKGMMGRYVKVLSGLMKAKRDRKTSAMRLKT